MATFSGIAFFIVNLFFIYIIVIFLIFVYISFSNVCIIASYVLAISREKARNFKMYKKELPRNGLSTRIQSSTNSSPHSSFA